MVSILLLLPFGRPCSGGGVRTGCSCRDRMVVLRIAARHLTSYGDSELISGFWSAVPTENIHREQVIHSDSTDARSDPSLTRSVIPDSTDES